ncbi:MAG: transglutaminase-like domain-containing protein [Myxococcota bacterium]
MGIQELWSNRNEEQLQTLLKATRIHDLAKALLAIEGASDQDVRWCMNTLDVWSDLIADLVSPFDDPEVQVAAMTAVLVDELGLRGERDDYYSPRNSFLYNAMRRRSGLPILMSAIWILVGERCGVEVDGVGLPCHFIARVGGDEGLYVDPFGSGRVLDLGDCQKMVRELSQGRISWEDSYLEPISTPSLVERVLHNLINSYSMSGKRLKLYRTVRLLAELRPDHPGFQFMHARSAEEAGASLLAAQLYEGIMEQFRDTEEAKRASIRLGPLYSQIRWMN